MLQLYSTMFAVNIFLTWLILVPFAVSGAEYSYDDPSAWKEEFPECGGDDQSPIALYSEHGIHVCLSPLELHHYDELIYPSVKATNNGHSISVPIGSTINGNKPSVSGGGLESVYEVEGFHFHWGSPKNRSGSEHTINGKRYDLECHIVHRNAKYNSIEEAVTHSDGLIVFGILLQGKNSKALPTGLNAVYDVLPNLKEYQSSQKLRIPITMRSLLGKLDLDKFYTYEGSLTTPPCSEAVTWFVFSDILQIENQYLKRFWNVKDPNGVPLFNNYRPIQNTGDREVQINACHF